MAKIRETKGNEYVDSTLYDNQISREDMDKLLTFLKTHKNVFLFGNGKCGKGLMEYCKICNFSNVSGFLNSDNVMSFLDEYIEGDDGIILSLKADYYPEVLPLLWGRVSSLDILLLAEKTKSIFVRTFSKEYISERMWITLPLAKHCNINCASCSMFSPICKKDYYSLENIKRDMVELKRINVRLSRFNISGGEPLLNPEFVDILEAIRSSFPEHEIDVYTNALLVDRLSENELKRIGKVSPFFMITDYELDEERLEKAYQLFDSFDIDYQVNHDGKGKVYFKKTIDFEKRVPIYEYINCQHYTFAFSTFLFNGVLYKCPLALNSLEINRFFEKDIELTEEDYLRLCDIDNTNQVLDFCRKRHPMCSYCPPVTKTIAWHRSERKIEEWT